MTTRKPLTDEQRAAKNARDRARRAAKKAEREALDRRAAEVEGKMRETGSITVLKSGNGAISHYTPHSEETQLEVSQQINERDRKTAAERLRQHTHPTDSEIEARQRYRDARVGALSKRPDGETWAERKARHRQLDRVLKEGGRLPQSMRRRPAEGNGRLGLTMRRPT